MRITIILLLFIAFFAGCSKMEDKKLNQNETKMPPSNNMQNPHTQGNMDGQMSGDKTDTAPESAVDEKADKLIKEANDFESTFKKSSSEENKKSLVEKHMAAGVYLMYQANLNPKKKYGPALKHFKRVLELDPNNQEAIANKMQIEDIYNSMGRPIPN
jgi:tetratricopeptide (TPR) repeat protein